MAMAPHDSVIQIEDLPKRLHPWEDLVPGYPRLAGQMGRLPQLGVFRRFGALNMRNLLYYQAELAHLEQDIIQTELDDARNTQDLRGDYCGNWADMSGSSTDDDHVSIAQWELVLKMRNLLKEYNKALVLQEKIVAMKEPGAHDLQYLQKYMEAEEMGPRTLTGEDSDTWGTTETPPFQACDLITLQPAHHEDAFSRWFTESALRKYLFNSWCHRKRKPSTKFGVITYREKTLLRVTHFITSILASMFPIASITILWFVTSSGARLGIIAAFNLVLSICLTGFTKATRAEVFAVTAAFAAVQVVFVGSTTGGGGAITISNGNGTLGMH